MRLLLFARAPLTVAARLLPPRSAVTATVGALVSVSFEVETVRVTLYAAPTTRMTSSSDSFESMLILKALPWSEVSNIAVPSAGTSMAVTVGPRDSHSKGHPPRAAHIGIRGSSKSAKPPSFARKGIGLR